MNWLPIGASEQGSYACDQCGTMLGLSRDDEGNVYCTAHRHLHETTS